MTRISRPARVFHLCREVPTALGGEKEGGTRAKKRTTGRVVGAMLSTVGLFGPYVVLRREGERGDGRARSRSSVGHWDVARGRDECGSHLQSVPVGQENHLWARRILCGRTREHDGKKKKKERKDSEGSGSR